MDRNVFEKRLQQKQQLISQCSPEALKMINTSQNMLDSLKAGKAVYKQPDHPHIYDYNVLNEHANRGSVTAKVMCDALEHFVQA